MIVRVFLNENHRLEHFVIFLGGLPRKVLHHFRAASLQHLLTIFSFIFHKRLLHTLH
jgi:hypothetical protein